MFDLAEYKDPSLLLESLAIILCSMIADFVILGRNGVSLVD